MRIYKNIFYFSLLFLFFITTKIYSLNSFDFANRNSYIVLNSPNSKFKISNADSIDGWKSQQIIRASKENTLFLKNNQVWENNTIFLAPEETFEFMNDLIIPDNEQIIISADAVIDGQGHNLILGHRSQLLIDAGVTVTFKNINIKNTFNTISQPPIRCVDWYSQAVFDNTTLSFNNDFAFWQGQMFFHNDVEFTGTSKFSYRSVRPSYITQHSNLIFDPQTTFEFYPSTADNDLIKMADKTSKMFFDGSTLQTTHTGIRLTKGSLYFDNKVTLSSAGNTVTSLGSQRTQSYGSEVMAIAWSRDGRHLIVGGGYSSLANELQVYLFNGTSFSLVDSKNYGTRIYSVELSPDEKYVAVGGNSPDSGDELQIYSFDGSLLTFIDSENYGTTIHSVSWGPDGQYIVIGGNGPASGDELQVYSFDGSSLFLVDSKNYGTRIYSVNWSPDGRYLAIGGKKATPSSENELEIYSFDGSSLSLGPTQGYGTNASTSLSEVAWSLDGKYIAIGGYLPTSGNELQIYSFDGSSLSLIDSKNYGTTIHTVDWSPDGYYLAVGGGTPASGDELQIYSFDGSSLSLIDSKNYGSDVWELSWNWDGNYLALGGQGGAGGHDELEVYPINYSFDTSPQGYSNSIIFGNSTLGSNYDLDVYVLGAARVEIFGKVLYDGT